MENYDVLKMLVSNVMYMQVAFISFNPVKPPG